VRAGSAVVESEAYVMVPVIYNLFPTLVGPPAEWLPHAERAREMGFNWLYVNPFRDPGFPGSLYAVKDYACRQGRFGLDLLRWCYL
jgi:hypothetical protein